MGESGERTVDEKLKAIDKRTGRYINVIKRTIDIDWELRRYQIVKDLLSNSFDGRKMGVDEIDNAIFTADLIINKLKTI